MLLLITVSLLKQVFCLYKFPLHIDWGMLRFFFSSFFRGGGGAGVIKKNKKDNSRLRRGSLIYTLVFFALIFPILWNKCSLLKDHVNNSFYAFLHCMKKAAPVTARKLTSLWSNCLREHGSDANPPVMLRRIRVGNNCVFGRRKKCQFLYHAVISAK